MHLTLDKFVLMTEQQISCKSCRHLWAMHIMFTSSTNSAHGTQTMATDSTDSVCINIQVNHSAMSLLYRLENQSLCFCICKALATSSLIQMAKLTVIIVGHHKIFIRLFISWRVRWTLLPGYLISILLVLFFYLAVTNQSNWSEIDSSRGSCHCYLLLADLKKV